MSSIIDKSSLSNPGEALVTHLDWVATVSFETKSIAAVSVVWWWLLCRITVLVRVEQQ
jgi:hypothetical protein